MAAFARQNRPGAAFTRSIEGAAVGLLPIAIVIVAPPARALRQIALEHLINHRDGINDQRIIRRTDAQPDKMEKIAADDIAGGMLAAAIGRSRSQLCPDLTRPSACCGSAGVMRT